MLGGLNPGGRRKGTLNQFIAKIRNTKHGIGKYHPMGSYGSNIGEQVETTLALMRDDPWVPGVVQTYLPKVNS